MCSLLMRSDLLPLDEPQDARDVLRGVEARNRIIEAIRSTEPGSATSVDSGFLNEQRILV